MKTATRELIDLLHGSDEFLMADLFRITLSNGQILRHTNADMPVVWNGQTYEAHKLIIKRGATRVAVGLDVDSNTLEIAAEPDYRLEGLQWSEAALGGALDGARVVIERIFFSDWATPVGAVVIFSGRVSDVSGSRSAVKVDVKSDIELLNVSSPRNIYQAGCMTELACNLTQADGWFNQGVIKFTSGRNAGLSRTVKEHKGGRLSFALRLPFPPQSGDVFKIYPGCDKRQETCGKKFDNIVHFRGFPYIPAADTIT